MTRSLRRAPSVLKFGTSSNWMHLAQLVGGVDLVDVELVRHDVRAGSRASRPGRKTSARVERLAHLDRGLAAGGPAQRRQPAGQRHLRLEVGVDATPAVGRGPVGQVHRLALGRRRSGGATWCPTRTGTTAPAAATAWSASCAASPAPPGCRRRARRGRCARSGGGCGGRTSWRGRRRGRPAAVAAASGSYGRQAPRSPSAVVLASRDRIQRSSGPRSAAAGIAGSAGSNSFSDAYVVKKLNVFHSVSSMSRMAVSMAPSVARVGVHGEPWLNIHQRMASAPRVSRIDQGSMMLPSDLDILRPSASTMWPEAHDVAVRALAEDERVDGQQRVEPAPRLVDGLGDEVGREGERLGRPRQRADSRPGPPAWSPSRTRRRSPARPGGTPTARRPRRPARRRRRTSRRRTSPRRWSAGAGRSPSRRARTGRTARPASRRSARGPRPQRQIGSGVPQ